MNFIESDFALNIDLDYVGLRCGYAIFDRIDMKVIIILFITIFLTSISSWFRWRIEDVARMYEGPSESSKNVMSIIESGFLSGGEI